MPIKKSRVLILLAPLSFFFFLERRLYIVNCEECFAKTPVKVSFYKIGYKFIQKYIIAMKFSNGVKFSPNISFLYLLPLTNGQQLLTVLWVFPVFFKRKFLEGGRGFDRPRKIRDLKNL